MRKITISYNPYRKWTSLNIDGIERKSSNRRIDSFITGQEIDSWLNPYVRSYRRWSGFLVELMEELNDDELALTFCGTKTDYEIVRAAAEQQAKFADEKGYSPEKWNLDYKEKYDKDVIVDNLMRMIGSLQRRAKLQLSSNIIDMVRKDLNSGDGLEADKLYEIYESLKQVISSELENASGEDDSRSQVWKKVAIELDSAFKGERFDG